VHTTVKPTYNNASVVVVNVAIEVSAPGKKAAFVNKKANKFLLLSLHLRSVICCYLSYVFEGMYIILGRNGEPVHTCT
jgi:hypothetical protein